MNVNFDANKTMKILGKTKCITADSKEGKVIIELLQGCDMPITNDNILLCSFAMQLGLKFGAEDKA